MMKQLKGLTTCGACGEVFDSDKEYFQHVCEITGFNPTQIEHLDSLSNGAYSQQSKSALARGEAKK